MNAPRRLVTDEAKALIGYNTPPRTTADLVTTSEVRRFAQAIMDDNPVFFDEEEARRSRFNGLVAPGTFPLSCLRPAPLIRDPMRGCTQRDDTWTIPVTAGIPTPPGWEGLYEFHAGDDVELYRLARVGDRITARTTLGDLYEKTGRSGLLAFLTLSTDWTNQHGELLCTSRLHTVWTEVAPDRPKPKAHSLLEPAPVPQPPTDKLTRLDFEDVEVGLELPRMIRRITAPVIMRWCAATEIFRRDHFDYTYATQVAGLPDVIGSGSWAFSCLWTYLSRFAGQDGWVWKMSQQLRATMLMGDTLNISGRVTAKEPHDGYGVVDVDVAVVNQDGTTVIPARGTVALPFNSGPVVSYPFTP